MKSYTKHFYLLYWICDNQRFEMIKTLYYKSFVSYCQQIE